MPKRRKTKKETGRRRRGKKDIILDFTKRVTKKATADSTETTPSRSKGKQTKLKEDTKQSNPGRLATIIKANTKKIAQPTPGMKSVSGKNPKGKLSLATSSSEYGGSLGLPEKITQREFESTGQFFRRLDRLVAKAKVEANMEARFDMTLAKEGQKNLRESKKIEGDASGGGGDLSLNDNDEGDAEQRVQHSYNKKRVKR